VFRKLFPALAEGAFASPEPFPALNQGNFTSEIPLR
jgi:hypothetical protein